MKNTLFLAILFFSFIGVFAQQKLVPVEAESKVHFVIKNFAINTGGDFSGLKGEIHFDAKEPGKSQMNVTVDAGTIDTDNDKRDKHLRSDDFFDATKYPIIRLQSTAIAAGPAGAYTFTGKLTIKDVTRPVEFSFTATPKTAGYLFEGSFDINRLDFHVGKESATMSEKVRVTLTVLAK